MNKFLSNPMRGMRDLLPSEVELRQGAISIIESVYRQYGFTQIETPTVENINLLTSNQGGENEKQIFQIMKRGLKIEDVKNISSFSELVDGGLRFDLTIPLVRYFSANQAVLPMPFKALQIGNVWRAERPQKGRYRQFIQCDIDVIGDKSDFAEKELIVATSEALLKLGFSGFKVRLNDRRILRAIVEDCGCKETDFDMIYIIMDKLDKIGLEGIQKELTSKGVEAKPVKKIIDFLGNITGDAKKDDLFTILPKDIDPAIIQSLKDIMAFVQSQTECAYEIVFDPTLVRGMGYYTGPIFEIEDKDYPVSIAGGGRYDKMVGRYLGTDIPACGFSIGFERIMSLLEKRGYKLPSQKEKKVLLFDPTGVDANTALDIAQKLRKDGASICLQERRKNIKQQLTTLAGLGYNSFAIIQSESDKINFKSFTR